MQENTKKVISTGAKTYEPPVLTVHGTVKEITQGGGVLLGDTLLGGSFIDVSIG